MNITEEMIEKGVEALTRWSGQTVQEMASEEGKRAGVIAILEAALAAREPLTEAQGALMAFLRTWFDQHEHAPSAREIADEMKCSRPNAHRALKRLEAKGYLHLTPGERRSIRLVD